MAERNSPQIGGQAGSASGGGSGCHQMNAWTLYDQQQASDEDDDEPRLMIDTSEEDDDVELARSNCGGAINMQQQQQPQHGISVESISETKKMEVSRPPQRSRKIAPRGRQTVAANSEKMMKNLMKGSKPVLDAFMKDLKGKKEHAAPGNFQRMLTEMEPEILKMMKGHPPQSFEDIIKEKPGVDKIMKEVKNLPAFEKAKKELASSPDFEKIWKIFSGGKLATSRGPKFSPSGCEEDDDEAYVTTLTPLTQLQELVHKPFPNTFPKKQFPPPPPPPPPLNVTISSGANFGILDCDPVMSMPSASSRPTIHAGQTLHSLPKHRVSVKSSRSSQSAKRGSSGAGELQLPQPPHLTSAPTISRAAGTPIIPIHHTAAMPLPPPLQKRPSTMDYMLSKMQNAARNEQQLQEELQRLHEEAESVGEMQELKNFESFMKSRMMNRPVDMTVATPPIGVFESSRLPGRPGCSFVPLPVPPALTVIPKYDSGGGAPAVSVVNSRKLNVRRSPPPMVPIESLATLRKPLNDDNVIYRLKRLGTDIELERSMSMPSSQQPHIMYEDEDEEEEEWEEEEEDDGSMFPLSVDCILSTEPIVTIDENPDTLSFGKYFEPEPVSGKNCVIFNRFPPPPPPSLIPITCTTTNPITSKCVSIVPSTCNPSQTSQTTTMTKSKKVAAAAAGAVINKKSKKKPKLSFKSDYAKLAHALVQPAGAAKQNEADLINTLRGTSVIRDEVTKMREVDIFKIVDDRLTLQTPPEETPPVKPIEKIVKRLKEKPAIDGAATKRDDLASQRAAEINCEKMLEPAEHSSNLCPSGWVDIRSRSLGEEKKAGMPCCDQVPSIEKSGEKATAKLLATAAVMTRKSPPTLFSFVPDQAVLPSELPNGRKLYTCDICSGVYCKMYSVKKHYFRYHVNPRMVSERDAIKFGLETYAQKPFVDEGLYRCNECDKVFSHKQDLKSHLLEHPPDTNENERNRKSAAADRYNCETCSLVFSKKKLYYRHLPECAGLATTTNDPKLPMADSQPRWASSAAVSDEQRESAEIIEMDDGGLDLDKIEEEEEEYEKRGENLGISRMCLFCEHTFTNVTARNKHVLQHHHPKRKHQVCTYCKNKKFSDLKDLLKHICEVHSKKYFGCADCKIRFKTRGDLIAHNAESHPELQHTKSVAMDDKAQPKPLSSSSDVTVASKNGRTFKCTLCSKIFATNKELKRHRKKGHTKTKNVKSSGGTTSTLDSYEQKYRNTIITSADYETEFYRNVALNVRYNVELCMDGKIVMKKPNDLKNSTRSSTTLSLRQERDTSNELNFQDMYGSDNLNGRFIRNVSRLHLATQLSMLRKANLLEKDPARECGASSTIAKELALKEKLESQLPHDERDDYEAIFSGEWIRSKKYICGACFGRFNNFWDVEDHRWIKHPNVWGFYYEFVTGQAPGANWAMKRCLQSKGALSEEIDTSSSAVTPSSTCTKCHKVVSPIAEFHKHILECGGDNTWSSTMFAASSSQKRHKKWRPYGCRRRRNTTRVRGLKRNIPTTPVKLLGLSKNRQKAGDSDTIQKMIANLPPKRITRRIIQFDDLDAKSQARFSNETNILTRRRKERMDAKTSAQIAKAFSTDGFTPQARNKQKRAANLSEPASPSDSQSETSTTSKKHKPIACKLETDVVLESAPDSSPSISDAEISCKESAASPAGSNRDDSLSSPPSPALVEPLLPIKIEPPQVELESPLTIDVLQPVKVELSSQQKDEYHELDTGLKVPEDKADYNGGEHLETLSRVTKSVSWDEEQGLKQQQNEQQQQTLPQTQLKKTAEDEHRELDPGLMEPADDDSQVIPDTSLILAAMRETMRQTDAVIPVQPFTLKKRKREGYCKKCNIKKDDLTNSLCEYCFRSEALRPAPFIIKRCGDCDCVLVGKGEEDKGICPPCKKKRASRPRGAPSELTSSKPCCSKCNASLKQGASATNFCDKCVQLQDAVPSSSSTCVMCHGPDARSDGVCEKCDLAEREPLKCCNCNKILDVEADIVNRRCIECLAKKAKKSVAYMRKVMKKARCRVCLHASVNTVCPTCAGLARKNKMCALCRRRWETPNKTVLPICDACKTYDTTPAARKNQSKAKVAQVAPMPPTAPPPPPPSSDPQANPTQNQQPERKLCRVCKGASRAIVCTNCISASQRLKICPRCNVQWNDTEKIGSLICKACEDEWQLECIEMVLCRVCRRPNLAVVCNYCCAMSQKHRICARCSVKWDDATNTAIPVCPPCQKEWYEDEEVRAINCENSSPATDCNAGGGSLKTNTSKILEKTPVEPVAAGRRVSCEASIQVNDAVVVTPTTPEPITTVVPVVLPQQTSAKPGAEEVPGKVTTSPKKNVVLICKGCYGAYDTVSSYKSHCETCQARVTCSDIEKKPLLGFAKRNGKGGVEIGSIDAAAASFEVVEGVQVKEVHENVKIEGDSSLVPLMVYDSDSSSSSRRLDSSKLVSRRSYASEDSINSTIESVIKSVCYETSEATKEILDEGLTPSNDSDSVVLTSQNMSSNFEKVKTLLLETANKTPPPPNKEISLGTRKSSLVSEAEEVIPTKKKKLSKRSSTLNTSRTTRSSRSLTDAEVASPAAEEETSFFDNSSSEITEVSEKNRTKVGTKKRKAEEDVVSLNDEESIDGGGESIASRLRRKPQKSITPRVLRPRTKADAGDIALLAVEDDSKNSEDQKSKRPLTETEEFPSKARKSRDVRKTESEVKNDDELRPNDGGGGGESMAKSKPAAKKKTDPPNKRSRSLSTLPENTASSTTATITTGELGFAITKTNRTILRNEKSCDLVEPTLSEKITSSTTLPKNELEESDRKLRRRSCESDPNSTLAEIPAAQPMKINLNCSQSKGEPGPAAAALSKPSPLENNVPLTADQSETCDFLGPTVPSATLAYESATSLDGFSYEAACDPAPPIDGYAPNCGGSSSNSSTTQGLFDSILQAEREAAADGGSGGGGGQSTSWYSDAINFLDQRSLGSILDSVNELLSRPEVVSSCSADSMNRQRINELKQNVISLQCYEESKKLQDEMSSMENDEDALTIMDLDQQPVFKPDPELEPELELEPEPESEAEEKLESIPEPEAEAEPPKTKNRKMSESKTNGDVKTPKTNGTNIERICDVCEQVYPSEEALNLHMVAIHQFDMFGNRCMLSGRLRAAARVIQNGMNKTKHRCSHCQKVLANKAEYETHIREHLKTFALNKSNADFLKKCIAEKLEDIVVNKVLSNYLKSPQESSNLRKNLPLKMFSQLGAAKKCQVDSWRTTIADLLMTVSTADSETAATGSSVGSSASSTSEKSTTSKPSKPSKMSVAEKKAAAKAKAEAAVDKEGYPCPMCPKSFQFTHMRNQHLIMVHAPRQSTHKHLKNNTGKKKDGVTKSATNGETNTVDPPGKPIRSYLLNEIINTCPESSKQPSEVENDPSDSSIKTIDVLRKQIGRPVAELTTFTSSSSPNSMDLQAELPPPALEPAPTAGEQLPNNADRSPPKLEAPVGISTLPVKRLQPLLPSTSVKGTVKPLANGTVKKCRKKMSKKEINLPPAVVKLKAEQALLELSISKFHKLR